MNHGKINPGVSFCPNCGEKFKASLAKPSCDIDKHNQRRKTGCAFCFDCGKKLKDTP